MTTAVIANIITISTMAGRYTQGKHCPGFPGTTALLTYDTLDFSSLRAGDSCFLCLPQGRWLTHFFSEQM